MSLLRELKRRNVFRVGAAYIVFAWLIIQVAETIFPLFGFGDGPARLVVILLAIGFIPALIFAWAFELTPQGLVREHEVDREHSITPKTGQKLDRTIMLVLGLALAYFAFDKFVLDPQRDVDIAEGATKAGVEQAREEARLGMFNDKSIAVLPFANRSEQKDDEYFTDGMHDELLTRLSRIAELTVISRTSVMRYRDTLRSIPDIAKELSVATVLEGGVQRLGKQVRINVQLIDAHTDEHLWAEIYDRELTTDNLFAIQSEISTAIADALQATLSPAEKSQMYALPTSSMEAYNHFLRGRQLMATRNKQNLEQARKEFTLATEIDSGFALAWVGVADVVHLLEGFGALDHDSYLDVHKQAVEKAVALNDQLGEAYLSLAVHYQDLDENEKAEAAFLKAIELNPNYVQAYHWYAISGLVSNEQMLQLLYKAAQLDPLSSIVQRNVASSLQAVGRIEEGRQVILSLLQRDPTFNSGYTLLGNFDADEGQLAQAIQWFRKALQLDPGAAYSLSGAGHALLALGDYEAVAVIQAEIDSQLGPDGWRSEDLKYWTYFAQSRWQESIDWGESLPEEEKGTPEFLWAMANLHLHAGEFEKALHYTLKREPGLADRERWQQDITDEGRYYCEYAGMMIEGGEEALGRDLLGLSIRTLESAISEDPESINTVEGAICYVLAGSMDKAMDMLERTMSQDFQIQWWYRWGKNPWWKRLEDNPRYVAMVEQIDSRLAEQRSLLEEMD